MHVSVLEGNHRVIVKVPVVSDVILTHGQFKLFKKSCDVSWSLEDDECCEELSHLWLHVDFCSFFYVSCSSGSTVLRSSKDFAPRL